MPIADAATPEPAYTMPADSSSAWTVPSSPNGPWSAGNTTGGRLARGELLQRPPPQSSGPLGAQRCRVVERDRGDGRIQGRLAAAATTRPRGRSASRAPSWPRSASAAAMARPETSDTSCSADGPPRSTRDGQLGGSGAVDGRWRSRRMRGSAPGSAGHAGPVAREDDLEAADRCRARRRTVARTRSPSRRTSAALPPWSLTMKLACFSLTVAPPIAPALQPQRVDDAAGRVTGGLRNDAAGRWHAQRLMRLAPAADLVEPRGDHRRIRRLEVEGGPGDDLRPAVGACLRTLSR